MKKILTGTTVGLIALLVGCDNAGFSDIPPDTGLPRDSTGIINMICELQLDLDGQTALGITANEPSRITLAQIDFDKDAGWYQGTLSISEGRAGTLKTSGNLLTVSRPAMFQRFGVTINREEFVIDRSNGSFTQSVSTQDGRTIILIRGVCAKVIRPPF